MGHFTTSTRNLKKENGVLLDRFETNSDASLFWWLCHTTTRWSSRSNNFYIFAIQTIPCSSNKTTEVDPLVVGAKNQLMVLATIVEKVECSIGEIPFIINHVRNCRLGCTIPCTQSILSFSLMKRHIILKKKKRPNAKSAMNLADNTLIAVTAATSTFTPHVLPYRPPSNLLKSTTTH